MHKLTMHYLNKLTMHTLFLFCGLFMVIRYFVCYGRKIGISDHFSEMQISSGAGWYRIS